LLADPTLDPLEHRLPTWLRCCSGSQPDRQKAKGWEEKRLRGQTHIHQSINGNGNIVGNINSKINSRNFTESGQESDDDFQPQPKRKKQLSLPKNSKESVSTKKVEPAKERNAETSSSSPSLEIPIVRPSTPEHQIYSTSVNQELIKQLNQEKKKVKSIL
ncbi:1088_t:CDS:2, partial [Funneliformis geosporum]